MSCAFWSRWQVRLAWPLAALLAPGAGVAGVQVGQASDAGVELKWRYESQSAGDEGLGRLTLEMRDSASGSPLRYAPGQIAAWLQRQRPSLSEAEMRCIDRVKSLVSTGIGRRADVDLNNYRLLTLNSDRTVAFINPFVGLNNAKLESIVTLPGAPRNWVHWPARAELWVHVQGTPERLLAIDTHRRRIDRTLELPPGTDERATLVADEGAQRLWLALPTAGRVAVLDLRAAQPSWRSAAAPGVKDLHAVTTSDGRDIFSLHADGRLIRWAGDGPATAPKAARTWSLPTPLQSLAYSPLARRLVAHDGQAVLSIAPDGDEVRRLALGHPVADLAIVDDGRYAMAVGGTRMSLVDLATGSVHVRSDTVPGARQLVLTPRFAYAVGADESSASMWALADLRARRVQPAQVLLGSAGTPRQGRGGLRRAVATPGGAGLLVANAADRLIYQYAEGMMAPAGSYSNYKRTPLAIELLDLAPREVAPGRYEVPVRYEVGGTHHLVVSGVGPRFAVCDRVALAATPRQAARQAVPELKAQLVADQPLPGARRRIVIALAERAAPGRPRPVAAVADLNLLLFDKRSGWQQRVRLHEQAGSAGSYGAEVAVPPGTAYELFVSSATRHLPYVRGRVSDALAIGQAGEER